MIEGVAFHKLRQFIDDRGRTMHMLRNDDAHFIGFGEVYFAGVHQGKVKGWYRHRLKTLNYAVPVGRVRVVIYDDRDGSPSHGQLDEHILGEEPDRYGLLTIPPLLWYGFQGLAPGTSLVANCSDLPNDPAESDRKPLDSPEVPYKWPPEDLVR
jgi:dTDP-4-dehydrorhamnose 3,5-epimerase